MHPEHRDSTGDECGKGAPGAVSLPTWDLFLPGVIPLVAIGPDQDQRERRFRELIYDIAPQKARCLQISVASWMGSKHGANFVSLDLYDDRPCIDFRCDMCSTPFNDGRFDIIVCNAVLEHVRQPFNAAREMKRILAPDGLIWVEVPFVQPYHPHKDYRLDMGLIYEPEEGDIRADRYHGGDYWRFTPQGIVELMMPLKTLGIYLSNQGGIAYYGQKTTERSAIHGRK